MKRLTVLCVDDYPAVRALYLILLGGYGYDVIAASSAYHALELFHARVGKIDAVIVDHQMPGMNGLELAISLKGSQPSLPILMIATSPPAMETMTPFIDAAIIKGAPVLQILSQLELLLSEQAHRRSIAAADLGSRAHS